VLVILYDKEMDDSTTLRSLSKSKLNNVSIIVINNGPKNFSGISNVYSDLTHKGCNIEVIEFIDNKPLSYLYNHLIDERPNYDYYVIMDDDSEIDIDEFQRYFDGNVDVIIPSIIEKKDGVKYYPLVNGNINKDNNLPKKSEIYSITSGLSVSKRLVKIFHEYGVNLFDERFALYGVDTSFYKRLNKIKETENILMLNECVIYHSLSRVSGEKNLFRIKERLYDEVLINMHYCPSLMRRVLVYIKVLIKCLRDGKVSWILDIYKLLVSRKHPRSTFKGS